jgi:hypothetical protein
MKTKICTTIEQSKKLIEFGVDVNTADMWYINESGKPHIGAWTENQHDWDDIPAWSLGALLDLTPQRILRKDKVHDEMAYVPSYRRIITPTSIFYSDGNNTMDYIQFSYGENGTDLTDATFKMICWLFKNGYIKAEKSSL